MEHAADLRLTDPCDLATSGLPQLAGLGPDCISGQVCSGATALRQGREAAQRYRFLSYSISAALALTHTKGTPDHKLRILRVAHVGGCPRGKCLCIGLSWGLLFPAVNAVVPSLAAFYFLLLLLLLPFSVFFCLVSVCVCVCV